MKIYIMRHGETVWNVERRLQGCADIPLNHNGIELAQVTADAMDEVVFDLIISSPLVRAVETAKIVTKNKEIPLLLDKRIQEISFADWEGLSCKKDQYEIPSEDFWNFFEHPDAYVPPVGGESIADICARTKEFYEELIQKEEYQDKTILISSHGCAVRAILQNIYADSKDFWHGKVPPNCSFSIVDIQNGKADLQAEDVIFYDESRVLDYTKA